MQESEERSPWIFKEFASGQKFSLFDNVQFIYELALARLELENLGANYELSDGLRDFKLNKPDNLAYLKKRLAYFKTVDGEYTDYYHIIKLSPGKQH